MRSKGGCLGLAAGHGAFPLPRQASSATLACCSFLKTPPGWQGCCAGPFKNHPTPPLEGWLRRVDSETAFVLVLCPGCSWLEGGGREEKEEEEGRGGQRGSRISETRPQNRLCFPSGKGPQDA